MEPDNSPDWLPAGWTVRIRKTNDAARKVKCYIDPSGEHKFYSKVQVTRYLETLNSCPASQKGISSVDNIVEEKNESPGWLPHGWTVEFKTRNSGEHIGRKYKIYIETATGCKFYSKPEVSRYLKKLSSGPASQLGIGSVNDHNIELLIGSETFSKPDMSQNCKNKSTPEHKSSISEQQNLHEGKHSLGVETISIRELPQGWITETKSRKSEDSKQKDMQSMHHSARDGITSKADLSQSCKTKESSITKEKKLHGGKQSTDDVVIESVSADEFPAGWIKETRTRKNTDGKQKDKYYTDLVTGYKFFSKTDALRYLKSGHIKSCKIKPKKRDINGLEFINGENTSHCRDHSTADITSSNPVIPQNCKTSDNTPKQEKFYGGKHSEVVVEKLDDELPPEWVKEIRSRKVGNRTQKIPYYKDPVSGYVFRSKPDALRYIQTGDINACKIKPTKEDIIDMKLKDEDISHHEDNVTVGTISPNSVVSKKCQTDDNYIHEEKQTYGGKHLVNDVVVERVPAHELPTGWIKEVRTRKVGNRIQKDPYYKDPVSGYVFRSKPDVVRYLQTGDINSCKIKPTKEDISDLKLKDKDISHHEDNVTVGTISPNSVVSKKCQTDDNYIHEEKQTYGGKHLVNDVVVERVPAHELPTGWIKEVRTRKVGNRIQKDPYYKDPVSGYVFRSKPDVVRYLQTGDINSCKIKPTKEDISDLKLKDKDISHREDNVTVGTISPNSVVSKKCRTDDNYIHEEKQTYCGKHLVNDVVVERVPAHELPTGWIKEVRTRKVGNRIQKDPYYKDPVCGYVFRSKPDVVRYLQTGDINSCKIKPTKEDIIDLKLKDKDISHRVDNFNIGTTSPYPDVSKKCRTNDNDIPEQKKPNGCKQLVNDVVVERASVDELPAGWIKEARTRMVGNRIQKDPYYTDPVSGYIFRSKLDVLRYLETGDINSCKMKPKKRDIGNLELNNEDIFPSSAAVGKKLKTTGRKLHFGKERSDVGLSGSLVAPEVGKRCMNVSDATMNISSPTMKAHEAKRTKVTSETLSKDSRGEESIKVSDANDIIASVLNDIFQDEELTENGSVKHSSRAQRSSKSKNQTMLGVPLRTSKRLAGQKHTIETVDKINIEAFPTAGVDAGETVTDAVFGPTVNTSAHNKVLQQLLAEDGRPEQEDAHRASVCGETIFDVEPLNRWKQDLQEGVPEKEHIEKKHDGSEPEKEGEHHASVCRGMSVEVESLNKTDGELKEAVCEKQQVDDKHDARPELQEAPPGYPYVGSWTADPCLEFAFKTLTGAIPVEENLSFQDYFQAEAFQTQKNCGVEQLESDVTPNDVTPQFDAMEKSVPVQQMSATPTQQLPENFSSPSFSLSNLRD